MLKLKGASTAVVWHSVITTNKVGFYCGETIYLGNVAYYSNRGDTPFGSELASFTLDEE